MCNKEIVPCEEIRVAVIRRLNRMIAKRRARGLFRNADWIERFKKENFEDDVSAA